MSRVARSLQVDLFISCLKIEKCILPTRSKHFREAEEGPSLSGRDKGGQGSKFGSPTGGLSAACVGWSLLTWEGPVEEPAAQMIRMRAEVLARPQDVLALEPAARQGCHVPSSPPAPTLP